MTKRPDRVNHSNSPNRQRFWLQVLTRGGIAVGGLLLLLIGGGIWRLQRFIQKDLAPLAQTNLTTTINRPVKLGNVREFSLFGVKFGASEIPATATDPDKVTVEAVEVGFDPIQLIFNRTLKLDVTLVNPEVYLEKDDQGRWLTTRIALGGKGGPIKTDLEKIRLRNGKLTLLDLSRKIQQKSPTPQPANLPVGFSQLNGTAQLLDNNQVMWFDIAAQANNGGSLTLKGDTHLKTQAANLQIRTQDLLAADITRIIQLPLTLQAGRVNGDLQVQLIPEQQTLLYGSAFVQGVTLQIPRLPQLLNNTQGNLSFKGTEIKLEKIATNYGKIPLVATGIIDRETGYKLTGQIDRVDVNTALETLKVKLPVPTIGEVKADIQLGGAPNKPILSGTVATLKPARIDKVDFQNVRSKFEFSTSNSLISLKDIQGTPTVGGQVTGAGKIQLGKQPQLNFNFTAEKVPGDAIAQIYNSTPGFQIGNVSGTGQLTGIAGNIQTVVQWQAPSATYPATGIVTIAPDRTVFFRDVIANFSGGKVQASGSYANQRWQAVAQASGIQVERLVDKEKLQNVSLTGAEFNGRLLLAGTTSPFKVASIRTKGAGVQIGGGTIAVSNIQLQDQNFAAQLVANNVRLGRILQNLPPALTGPLAGTFQIAGSRDNFSLKNLRGTGEGSLAVASGTVTAKNIQLADGVYLAQVKANNLALPELAPNIQQFPGRLNGDFDVAGSVDSFKPESIVATGQARVKVADGTITASNIQLAEGRYQAVVAATGVKLQQLNQQLRGQFGGNLQVAGTVQSAKLADVRAAGQVQFSQGIGAITQPLTAAIAWDGQRLNIERATAANLNASGYILANAQGAGIPQITDLKLNVQAQNYDLQQLPIKLPNAVNLAGKADFTGQIAGNLPLPNIQGQLKLRNLAVKNFAFEPVLSGNIQSVQGQGTSLDVAGTSDRITVNLNANNRPNSFLVKWKEASAVGQAQGENLALRLDNFPIQVLNLSLPANTRLGNTALAGALTGNLLMNQDTLAASGNVAIANPAIGRIQGELLTAQFRYGNGMANITDSAFVKGKSRYAFIGNVSTTTKTPQIQGKLNINQGNVQDILTAIQVYELQDLRGGLQAPAYGTSADLVTVPQGLPNQPLLTQIERVYQVDALLTAQQQQRRETNPIPELADIQGTFNGEVAFDTANGIAAQFNLAGQNWTWGKAQEKNEPGRFYQAEQLIAKGSFEKGILTLLPLRIESKNRLIAFKGTVGGKEQSGNLQIRNFPIQVLNNFVKLPIGLTGNLNTSVAVAGSIDNPKARGELQVTEGTINTKNVESATASFSYDNGRLNFGSNFIVNGPEPVNITGSIPYKLPFASVTPNNNQISLDIKVKNEGLALLNLFTNQIAFDNGQGEVDVQIRGTRTEPIVNGVATLNNATFSAQALPEKLTEVTGTAKFDFDRIIVENLQGKFSQGKVEASGQIPIANSEEVAIENPLRVNLNQLALNLKGLYQGNANGNVLITGSALNPILGGKVELFNGQVLLAESTNTNRPEDSDGNLSFIKADKQNKEDARIATTRFNNLELSLGRNVKITRPPILNFQATGTLIVNGSLNQPIPDGKIKLEKGGVNLFTTQFNLARGYEHTATFRKDQPRDPNLDIRLFAKVLDGNLTGDISKLNTTGLSTLETIRVEARVQGPASKLNESLQLTSTPSRGETELVALLGGGFVDTQGRGDSTLGLINIAGSAVFNNFQGAFNQIGSAFGLSEFRLFPTVISDNPEAGKTNSTLELAMEAGVDISSKFSISGIKILTANDPLQWGINYRINDTVRLRGSTNLDDDSRVVVEYDRRF
ncbi:translocation/assembly module TamB domain-containing protein [Tolypothrix sp. FACHB-123]|uniref:translocation/assembly module TamB domain-containing protein n=1 Tax=Tolypothrix sp. FACHB-123 TaxID=2692868 RepID=UPI00168454DB|nr:translocation/assembly module TamB domain-containing protein [Tolypothrix sp. FACHB-123]MBD2357194.1 translocation/assembly module TamB domain-containing protein [Tolypothrix sp. FACHB-123]